MAIVSPSLLACDFLNIESELKALEDIKKIWLHLDIMDGHFVPNLTFGPPIIRKISRKTKHKLDGHFMVTNPEFYCDMLQDYGIHNFTFHLEAVKDPIALITELKKYYPSVGVSIKPKTSGQKLTYDILKLVDLVLVMGVEPGFGGQKFIPETISKVAELKDRRIRLSAHYQIQVDGGVTNENAKALIDAGADNLVAGTYIFRAGPAEYANKIASLVGV